MGKALRVLNNCAIGGCASMNIRTVCPECPHWTPSRGSKYRNCSRWQTQRVICDLPRSACEGCDHYIRPEFLPTGRPNESGIDWTDPDEVREYYAERQRKHREKAKEQR